MAATVEIALGKARSRSGTGGALPVMLLSNDELASVETLSVPSTTLVPSTVTAADGDEFNVVRIVVTGDSVLACAHPTPSGATKFVTLPDGVHEFGVRRGEKIGFKLLT